MKLMQIRYVYLRKVEIELRQLEETDRPPERPSKWICRDTFKNYGHILKSITLLATESH